MRTFSAMTWLAQVSVTGTSPFFVWRIADKGWAALKSKRQDRPPLQQGRMCDEWSPAAHGSVAGSEKMAFLQ
jgi:hypothetical protein